jgi:hypothetical protein
LLTAGTTGEAPVDALVPESPAQRAAFAERALTAMSPGRLADIAFTELQQREAASLPAGMGDADRINALGLIARIAERDYAYRLELSKAIRQEIMTADLGRPARPASRGHSGVLSLAVTITFAFRRNINLQYWFFGIEHNSIRVFIKEL